MKSRGKHHRSLSVGPFEQKSDLIYQSVGVSNAEGSTEQLSGLCSNHGCSTLFHGDDSSYPLSTEFEERRIQQLENRYGGRRCANVAARIIQQAYRAHYFKRRFQNLRLSMLINDNREEDTSSMEEESANEHSTLRSNKNISSSSFRQEKDNSNVLLNSVPIMSDLEELSEYVDLPASGSSCCSAALETQMPLDAALLANSYYRLDSHMEDIQADGGESDRTSPSIQRPADCLPPAMHLLSSPLRRVHENGSRNDSSLKYNSQPRTTQRDGGSLEPSGILISTSHSTIQREAGCRDSGLSYTSTSTISSVSSNENSSLTLVEHSGPPAKLIPTVKKFTPPINNHEALGYSHGGSSSLDSGVDDVSPNDCCHLGSCSCRQNIPACTGSNLPTSNSSSAMQPSCVRRHTTTSIDKSSVHGQLNDLSGLRLPNGNEEGGSGSVYERRVPIYNHNHDQQTKLTSSLTPTTTHRETVNCNKEVFSMTVVNASVNPCNEHNKYLKCPHHHIDKESIRIQRRNNGDLYYCSSSPVWKRKGLLMAAAETQNTNIGCHSHAASQHHCCCTPIPQQYMPYQQRALQSTAQQVDSFRETRENSSALNSANSRLQRKRLYRVGLNLFNKKPYQGMEFLVSQKFVQDSARHIAYFLLTRKGLSRQMVGDFLGDKRCEAILKTYCGFMDFRGLQIDDALRKFNFQFLLAGESDRILRITEHFSLVYWHQNAKWLQESYNIQSADALLLLIYSILMLNTDLNSGKIKPSRRMKVKEFTKNLKGLNGNRDFDSKFLNGIYQRIQQQPFQVGEDHTSQVKQISELLLPEGSLSYPPHRRLVCLCKMQECLLSEQSVCVPATPSLGAYLQVHHQLRYVFLFNDTIVVACRAPLPSPSDNNVSSNSPPVKNNTDPHNNRKPSLTTNADKETQAFVGPFLACVGPSAMKESFHEDEIDTSSQATLLQNRMVRYRVVHMTNLCGVKAHLLFRGEQLYAVQLRQAVNGQVLFTLRAISSSDFIHFLDDLRECLQETNEMEVMRINGHLSSKTGSCHPNWQNATPTTLATHLQINTNMGITVTSSFPNSTSLAHQHHHHHNASSHPAPSIILSKTQHNLPNSHPQSISSKQSKLNL